MLSFSQLKLSCGGHWYRSCSVANRGSIRNIQEYLASLFPSNRDLDRNRKTGYRLGTIGLENDSTNIEN